MKFNNFNIEKLLIILAKDAFPFCTKEEFEKLQDFEIYFLDEFIENNNIVGKYYFKNHKIRIFGTPMLNRHYIFRTAIHEYAHHINYMMNNGTDHDVNFFAIFTKLIHSALDFGLLCADELLSDSFTKDRDKVKIIVNKWENKNPEKFFDIRINNPEFFVDEN